MRSFDPKERIKALLARRDFGAAVTVRGWVRTRRDSKGGFSFLDINDGSCLKGIQVIAEASLPNYETEVKRLCTGCCVRVEGELRQSPGKGQAVEILARKLDVVGWVEQPEKYPLSKKRHTMEYLREVAHLFQDKPLYIADGHHRYTTALACRKRALERDPKLAADSPYNFIMMYLCACEDPGLSVLPTHRLLNLPGQVSADQAVAVVEPFFEVNELPGAGGSRESLVRSLIERMDECSGNADQICMGMYHPGEDRAFLICSCAALLALAMSSAYARAWLPIFPMWIQPLIRRLKRVSATWNQRRFFFYSTRPGFPRSRTWLIRARSCPISPPFFIPRS